MKTASLIIVVLLIAVSIGFSQSVGIPKIPEDWIKTTLLIERREVKQVKRYLPLQGAFGLKTEGNQLKPIPLTNVFVQAEVLVTNYYPIGSGLLLDYSNINFIVTANHVVSKDEDVFYRIPQKESKDVAHYSHLSVTNRSGIGWIRDSKNDLAITIIPINAERDDVKKIVLTSTMAKYEDIAIGDHVFIVGYPSSVLALSDPTIALRRPPCLPHLLVRASANS